ncbi:sigma factor-like helix-turn-helix DNA-binding protein [Nocardia abscessus]|uniref:sigma factor-like helix-turn-helix DNA-binding protein n=1 Tax=Nocardia abscessus TaxID=120957 RepID=UPI003CC7FF2A
MPDLTTTGEDYMNTTPDPGGRQVTDRNGGDPAVIASTETFLAHRNLLFTVAYEMLGSTADAENVLQETWLCWRNINSGQVSDPRAYLIRTLTRRSLHRLWSMKRAESSAGPWLPEPLPTTADTAHHVELAERMSRALMLVLETLSPTERAVYVLREAFDLGYDEIADAVGTTTAVARRIAYRARRHVTVRRPHRVVSADRARAAAESLQRALETGEPHVLLEVLAPNVVLVCDGGGVERAAIRPVTGAEKVARFVVGGLGTSAVSLTGEPVTVNGTAALAVHVDGELDGILAIGIDGDRITGLYFVRNLAEPAQVESETRLSLR